MTVIEQATVNSFAFYAVMIAVGMIFAFIWQAVRTMIK